MSAKRPSDSEVTTTHLVMPESTNQHGSLFGGQMVAWMDLAASMAAMRHAKNPVVTVSIDSLSFKKPILEGQAVLIRAWVDWVGRSSMEVAVTVHSEDLMTGERLLTNEAFLSFVAIDEHHQPVRVPQLSLETEADRRQFEAAAERRARRLPLG